MGGRGGSIVSSCYEFIIVSVSHYKKHTLFLPLGLHLLRCMENDVDGEEEDQSALATEKREATDLSR